MSSDHRRYRAARVIALILLTVVYYVVPWSRTGAVAGLVGLPLLLLQVLVLPGYILLNTLQPRARDPFEILTGSLLVGLAYFLALAFVTALTGMPLDVFRKILPVAVLAPAALEWRGISRAKGENERPHSSPAVGWLILFSAVIVLTLVLVFRAGAPVGHTKDTLDHVGYIQEIRDTGESFPKTAFYVENDDNGRDIRKGLLHVFYAFASDFLGMTPLRFLSFMGAVFSVVLMLAVYSLALAFFGDRRVAVLSALLFMIGPGGAAGQEIRTSFYPNRFGMAFLFLFWIHAVGFVRNRNPRDAIAAGVLAFAACATHVFYAIVVVFTGLTLKLWKICFPFNSVGEHFRRVAVLGFVVIAGLLPYALYRFVTASPQANELHTQVQGVLFITDALYVVNPIRLWAWLGPIGVLSFLTLVPLWPQRGKYAGLGYLIASLVTIPLVLLNPLLLPLLHDAMTYLAFRLILISPFYLLPAFFLVRSFSQWRAGSRPGVWSHMLTGLILIAVAVQLKPLAGAALDRGGSGEEEISHLQWEDGLRFLATFSGPVVVASDPVTSYSIAAFTRHYVLCTLDQHAPPNDLRIEERVRDAREVLSPFVSAGRSLELMNKHGATHVVLNHRFSGLTRLHYWSVDPAIYPVVRSKFVGRPDLFETLFDEAGFTVLRARGREADRGTPPNPFLLDSIPDGFQAVGRPAGVAGLEAVSLERREVERGETMELDLIWSTGGGKHPLANYVVAIRFNHDNPGLPLAGKPFPKLTRKIMQVLRGERYRFRGEHKIVGGLLGPDAWEANRLVLDSSRVRIPRDMAPGAYTVSARVLAVANQPNYRLRDLLYDDDVYQGIPIGRVEIR